MHNVLNYLFIFAFLASLGWVCELIYRSFCDRKFVNPGFMNGPYLILYGINGLIAIFICYQTEQIVTNNILRYILIFFSAMIIITAVEYIAGIISTKYYKVRLWDYTNNKYNYKGLICPTFSILWGFSTLIFYILLYDQLFILAKLFVNHNFWLFILGLYYGVFLIDLLISLRLLTKIKDYAQSINMLVILRKFSEEIIAKYNQKAWRKFIYSFYPYGLINKFMIEYKNKKGKNDHDTRKIPRA